jgi:CheY-like chemotaxis protein
VGAGIGRILAKVTMESDPPIILVVDSDPAAGAGPVSALPAQGYDVMWAVTGGEAIRLAAAESPALVLLDPDLPDMDAVDLCCVLSVAHPAATIVVSSVQAADEEVIAALEAGADDYLDKRLARGCCWPASVPTCVAGPPSRGCTGRRLGTGRPL